MSGCCAPEDGHNPDSHADHCPRCGARGPRVDAITLRALLSGEGLRRGVPSEPRFCGTPGCTVVYFDSAVPVVFEEALVTVPVHVKHPEDGNAPVCYCFAHTPGTIRGEVTRTGRSSASAIIATEVKAGHCACEAKNPKGTCCLGDVLAVERSAMLPAGTPLTDRSGSGG
ncbi:MAG: hypothetical protein IT186_04230 [Acidobacteria bacterium]|nr:hypothetical protein [Acidobacteriota bacterium]